MNKGQILFFSFIILIATTIGFFLGAYWMLKWCVHIGLDILAKEGVQLNVDPDILSQIIWSYKEQVGARLGV